MGKYFYLQCKRMVRYLLGAFLAALLLLGGLCVAFSVMVQQNARSEQNQKIQVAMVGTADDTLLQMGLAALKNLDSTQFSIEIVEMEQQQAHQALEQGAVGAYIVIPEGFVEEAMDGHILPLKFVSTTGAAGVVSVFKEEVTQVISNLLLESQRGVYGMHAAMKDNGIGERSKKMTALALTYVEYVLVRDCTYSLQELGISDALGIAGYLLCGLSVLFLMLCCLPFAPLMIPRDMSLGRMLAARGRGVLKQALCDLAVYGLSLLAMVILLAALAAVGFHNKLEQVDLFGILMQALPVVVLVTAFSFMLYALSSDLIGGVLLQFFVTLAVCFVSGCMYPVYFFPVAVQKVAAWLPAGIARSQLSGCITGETSPRTLVLLLVYAAVFCLVGVVARMRSVKEARV